MSLWQSFKRLPEQEQKRQFEILARSDMQRIDDRPFQQHFSNLFCHPSQPVLAISIPPHCVISFLAR